MPLGTELGLGPGDFVLNGDPTPPDKKGIQPPTQFSAHVYCGQTAGWMKMPLGTEVDLDPGHIVLNGDPAPPPLLHSVHPSPQPKRQIDRFSRFAQLTAERPYTLQWAPLSRKIAPTHGDLDPPSNT